MKPFDQYRNPLFYPNKINYTTVYGYTEGEINFKKPGYEYDPGLHKAAVVEKVLDEVAFKAAMKEYNTKTAEMNEQFKLDCFEDFGIEDNPRREKCFAYAWEHGHSGGFSEVHNMMIDLVDIIE